MNSQVEAESTDFDWLIYSSATLAGLAALIPFPIISGRAERYFRMRMLPSIAARRNVTAHPRANKVINHTRFDLPDNVRGCLFWPAGVVIDLALRFSRKVLYFLAVKNAVDSLSYYWQRAYLLDHMVQQGYVSDPALLRPASAALEDVLDRHSDSPLNSLARQVIGGSYGALRNMGSWFRSSAPEVTLRPREIMNESWDAYAGYFRSLREEYEASLRQRLPQQAS
ncbi:MAG: hypothetical protein ACK2UO_03220 [Caldilineaceae bacterium]